MFRRVVVEQQGLGIEAAARNARYAALRAMAAEVGCELVLLAHHREDQAETVLLQALRGAGVAGLSAMPRLIQREGVNFARPWLQCPRVQVEAYANERLLRHIEDDSNSDRRYARNRLRLNVWPALAHSFGDASKALGTVARHAQEATRCLSDLADIDLRKARSNDVLLLSELKDLPEPRRANALRHWLAQRLGSPAPYSVMQRLLAQASLGRAQSWPLASGQTLRLYRGKLSIEPAATVELGCVTQPEAVRDSTLRIKAHGTYPLPGWGGSLLVLPASEGQGTGAGIDLAHLALVHLRARRGGELFQLALGRPPRSLKKQYQAAGVPAWQRTGPLLWLEGRLLFVPGLGVDAYWSDAGASQSCHLRWCPSWSGCRPG
ncbi:MAG: hypothetical protein RIQ60_847 [Pseudomonadota bacterium]